MLDDQIGVLLVGHGTRNDRGTAEFLAAAAGVAGALPDVPVEACFLELAAPDIAVGVERLFGRGVRRLVVAPLLLFAAGHAKQDIPRTVAAAVSKKAGITWRSADPLGCGDEMVEFSALRFREALVGHETLPADQTGLLMVGRGGSDADAIAQMQRFTELRAARTPAAVHATCFVAVARPSLRESLAAAAAWPCRRVVVQPHLLFHGEVLGEIQKTVEQASAATEDKHWIVASHLGVAPPLIEAITRRIEAAGAGFGGGFGGQ